MELNNKTFERIVYNSVDNDTEFRRLLVGSYFPYKKYTTDVEIKKVIESRTTDGYLDIYFKVVFNNLENNYFNTKSFDKHGCLTINKLLYTQYNRELTLQEMAITQEDKIRKSLNDYLEFDSDELFKSKFNIVRIFGGAIRDIIADQNINDVEDIFTC